MVVLWTFFKWRPKFPLCVKCLWQKLHLKGLWPVCFLKWSLRLHDFLKTLPQSGYMHLKYSLTLLVSGFLTLMVSCHSSGIPLKVLEVIWDFKGLLDSFSSSMMRSSMAGEAMSWAESSAAYLVFTLTLVSLLVEDLVLDLVLFGLCSSDRSVNPLRLNFVISVLIIYDYI